MARLPYRLIVASCKSTVSCIVTIVTLATPIFVKEGEVGVARD